MESDGDTLKARAADAPFGIAAAFDRRVSRLGDDDWRAAVWLADARGDYGATLVTIVQPDLQDAFDVREDMVAALVEEVASRLPDEQRTLAGITTLHSDDESHPGLRLDEHFPKLWRAILPQ